MANERRLIDSAELISMLPIVEEDKQISLIGAVADVVTMISECKPVDAVEVVRCRDCVHWDHGDCYRLELSRPDAFCAYGEKSGTQPQWEGV